MASDVEVGNVRSPEEWARIREICCETGASGRPVEPRERWPFFGEFWIGPYERLLPDWTFVARSGGEVVGYLTGCPDSLPFYARRLVAHRVPLALGAVAGRWAKTEDVVKFLHPAHRARRAVAPRFGLKLYGLLLRRYPAHLHINVREGERAGGVGRKLTEAYVARLQAIGARGLHLFCGPNPVAFYRRVGFHKLACRDLGKGPVFVMARRIKAGRKVVE